MLCLDKLLYLWVLSWQVEQPAFAVTGVNNEEDLASVLIQLGIVAFGYLIIMPVRKCYFLYVNLFVFDYEIHNIYYIFVELQPIILNWLRIRWYRRNLLEMYFQFMFVFIFFPGWDSLLFTSFLGHFLHSLTLKITIEFKIYSKFNGNF